MIPPNRTLRLAPARASVWAVLAFLILLVAAPPTPVLGAEPADGVKTRERGPWYTDLRSHWARDYVRVLWEEGVSPPPHGTVPRAGTDTWSSAGPFAPDARITRTTYADMIVRVFPGGSFPPPEVALELAGRAATIAPGPEPGRGTSTTSALVPAGRPETSGTASLRREEAVTALVEALGLGDFARSLDPADADAFLASFHDRSRLSPAHRLTMALAVHLRIIEGYPDKTLRPLRLMTRAEGATVVYRSCLLLAQAAPNPFSPDDDGIEDTTRFFLGSLRNHNARGWDFFVLDASGTILKHLRPKSADPAPPPSLDWDGTDDAGRVLTPGVYYYRGRLADRKRLVHWSALKPIVLEQKGLRGYAHPSIVLPGEAVHLWAVAAGGPSGVNASLSSFPAAGHLHLERDESPQRWETVFSVPADAEPGPCTAAFTALWPEAIRRATALFEVARFSVTGELAPNPAAPGQHVQVTAWPNLPSDACEALFELPGLPGRRALASLTRRTDGPPHLAPETWTGELLLPRDTPPDLYPVTLVAHRDGHVATGQLWLEVSSQEERLTFVLSD